MSVGYTGKWRFLFLVKYKTTPNLLVTSWYRLFSFCL